MADEKAVLDGGEIPVSQGDNSISKHENEDHKLEVSSGYPEGGFQAWLVVSGAAAVMFCTFGYLTGFGYGTCHDPSPLKPANSTFSSIYQQWYSEHQLKAYTLSDISWIGSVQIFLNFAGGLVGGPILDRKGNVVRLQPIPRPPLYAHALKYFLDFTGSTTRVCHLCGVPNLDQFLQGILPVLLGTGSTQWHVSGLDVQHFSSHCRALLSRPPRSSFGHCHGRSRTRWCDLSNRAQ